MVLADGPTAACRQNCRVLRRAAWRCYGSLSPFIVCWFRLLRLTFPGGLFHCSSDGKHAGRSLPARAFCRLPLARQNRYPTTCRASTCAIIRVTLCFRLTFTTSLQRTLPTAELPFFTCWRGRRRRQRMNRATVLDRCHHSNTILHRLRSVHFLCGCSPVDHHLTACLRRMTCVCVNTLYLALLTHSARSLFRLRDTRVRVFSVYACLPLTGVVRLPASSRDSWLISVTYSCLRATYLYCRAVTG